MLLSSLKAQELNWKNTSAEQKHLLHASAGAAFGSTAGFGYHQLVFIKKKLPAWLGGALSIPFGDQLADDFKVRLGTQVRLASIHSVQLAVRLEGIARRYQNQSVSLFNFGSDLAATLGYYRTSWFLAIEAGFDKAIVTHFKHSEWYKRNIYSSVQDGWYEPATGGNFYFGLQGGLSFKNTSISFKAGKLLQQDFRTTPLLPFYATLGVQRRF